MKGISSWRVAAWIFWVFFSAVGSTADILPRPLQLVRPDASHTLLEVVEENVRQLQDVDDEVALVAVLGRLHTGKSFLANQLLNRSAGFILGPSVEPQTQGLWIWSEPVQVNRNKKNISMLFLDTEGFFSRNVSESYDAKVFSVAILLSSYAVFTTKHTIDVSDIEYLELLVRRTELFGLRIETAGGDSRDGEGGPSDAAGGSDGAGFKVLFKIPPLLWVVSDFFLDLAEHKDNATVWLKSLMAARRRDHPSVTSDPHNAVQVPNRARARRGPTDGRGRAGTEGSEQMQVLDVFPSVECVTLPMPHHKEAILRHLDTAAPSDLSDDFLHAVAAVRDRVLRSAPVKTMGTKPLTGAGLVTMLRVLVEAANTGVYPSVPSAWTSFLATHKRRAVDEALSYFKTRMRAFLNASAHVLASADSRTDASQDVANHKETAAKIEAIETEAVLLLQRLLFNMQDAVGDDMAVLQEGIAEQAERFRLENERQVERRCKQEMTAVLARFSAAVDTLELPMPTTALHGAVRRISDSHFTHYDTALAKFKGCVPFHEHRVDLKVAMDGTEARQVSYNRKLIESIMDDASATLAECVAARLTSMDSEPLTDTALRSVSDALLEECRAAFDASTRLFATEAIFPSFRSLAKERLKSARKEAQEQNERRVHERCVAEAQEPVTALDTEFGSLRTYVNHDELEANVSARIAALVRAFTTAVGPLAAMLPCRIALQSLKDRLEERGRGYLEQNSELFVVLNREIVQVVVAAVRPQLGAFWFRSTAHRHIFEMVRLQMRHRKLPVASPALLNALVVRIMADPAIALLMDALWTPALLLRSSLVTLLLCALPFAARWYHGITHPSPRPALAHISYRPKL